MGSGQIITDYLARGSGPPSDPPSLGAGGQWALYQDTATGLYYQWDLATAAWIRLAAGALTQAVPGTPVAGDMWWSSDDGNVIDYYDGTNRQHVATLAQLAALTTLTVPLDASGAPQDVLTQDATTRPGGFIAIYIRTDASVNACTVTGCTPSSGPQQTINGVTTYALVKQYQSVTMTPDGTGNWLIVAETPGIG